MEYQEKIKYHSFILFQTKDKSVIQKFPYTVSSQSESLTSTESISETYNYCFDCSFYQYKGYKFLLAEVQELLELLSVSERQYINKHQSIKIKNENGQRGYCFYVYNQSIEEHTKKFIQINQIILHKSGIIFCILNQISSFHFQEFNKQKREFHVPNLTYYCFVSEFAIVSDDHFLNVLTKKYRKIGSYKKMNHQLKPFVDKEIYYWIISKCLTPKL